jgi:hypothetical protein
MVGYYPTQRPAKLSTLWDPINLVRVSTYSNLLTECQDKKSTYQNNGVCVDSYDVMGEDKSMYYGQIQEIWEFDFHGFKIPLFRCNWVDANKSVVKYKYGFITVDLNC